MIIKLQESDKDNFLLLCNLYLRHSSNIDSASTEIEDLNIDTEIATWWHYPSGEDTANIQTGNYMVFIFNYLLPELYRGKLFKLNSLMSKLVFKGDQNLIQLLHEYHKERTKEIKTTKEYIKNASGAKLNTKSPKRSKSPK